MSQPSDFPSMNDSNISMKERSHRNSTFTMTLPFDQDTVRRYITDGVLHRTQRRWEWFAEAQWINPGLGTLTYLPAEVRYLIWGLCFECRDTLSSDGLWEYDRTCGPIFDLGAYYFGFGRRGLAGHNGLQGLRLVSSAVKGESDDVFLTFRSFRFNQAENLAGFINQLTPASAGRLRSIDVGICTLYQFYPWATILLLLGPLLVLDDNPHIEYVLIRKTIDHMESWMDPVTRLPPGLREVKFRVYPVLFGWYDTDRGQESLKSLSSIVDRAVQSSPGAKISIQSTNHEPLSPRCQEAADAILERLQRQKEYQTRLSSNIARSSSSEEAEYFDADDGISFWSQAS